MTLTNTLLHNNCDTYDVTVTSNSGNLESPGNTCRLTGPIDQVNVASARIGPLADNGGPTKTHALLGGSPAIGRAVPANGPATDQRVIARPQPANGKCDVGAYELENCGAGLETALMAPTSAVFLRRRRSKR